MKLSFHPRLLNGHFDDPGLYIRVLREGIALLFDAGFTPSLSVKDILKINCIFVSHTHIDHFIGFDAILRLHLKKESPLKIYGPEGFTGHIEGKLKSYTWNLIRDYPAVIEVSEINDKVIKKSVFKAENFFKREDLGIIPFEGIVLKESLFKVSAEVLNHQIPCLAFCLEEDYHINIDKAELNRLNLPVGPWLGELKNAIRKNKSDAVFRIKDKEFSFAGLKGIAGITRGQKISYVVDVLGSEDNIKKIVKLVKDSDILFIEAYFLDEERERAGQRYHLTARQAGMIAKDAGVGKLVVFHFSPRYADKPEELIKEAEAEFRKSDIR